MAVYRKPDQLDRIRRFDAKFRFGPRIVRVMKVVLPLAILSGIAGGLLLCQFVEQFRPLIQLWIFAPILFAIASGGITFGIFYFFFNYGKPSEANDSKKKQAGR